MKCILNVLFSASVLSLLCVFSVSTLFLTGCSYNMSMANTQGTASDTIDDTSSNTPSTQATINVPASVI